MTKDATGLVLPEGFVSWVAKWDGQCCKCNKQIKQKKPCVYHKVERKLLCKRCAKKVSAEGSIPAEPSESTRVMDRIKVLLIRPKPRLPDEQAELDELAGRLRYSFSGDYSARRLLIEIYGLKVTQSRLCIENKFGQKCHRCGSEQLPGWAVMWDKAAHRIWCLECELF